MKFLLLLSLVVLTTVNVYPQDALSPLPSGSLQIGGFVGTRIDLCLRNRVMAQDVDLLIKPFREKSDTSGIWMTFNVPLLDEAGSPHFMKMCDYASAGNTWQQDNIFRVWVHQPFDLRHLYINKLNWRVINPFSETDDPPAIPERYKK